VEEWPDEKRQRRGARGLSSETKGRRVSTRLESLWTQAAVHRGFDVVRDVPRLDAETVMGNQRVEKSSRLWSRFLFSLGCGGDRQPPVTVQRKQAFDELLDAFLVGFCDHVLECRAHDRYLPDVRMQRTVEPLKPAQRTGWTG